MRLEMNAKTPRIVEGSLEFYTLKTFFVSKITRNVWGFSPLSISAEYATVSPTGWYSAGKQERLFLMTSHEQS